MCYIVFISRIQRPLRPASVFSMMIMMMLLLLNNFMLCPLLLPSSNSSRSQECKVFLVRTSALLIEWVISLSVVRLSKRALKDWLFVAHFLVFSFCLLAKLFSLPEPIAQANRDLQNRLTVPT